VVNEDEKHEARLRDLTSQALEKRFIAARAVEGYAHQRKALKEPAVMCSGQSGKNFHFGKPWPA
jgi:hypothetical protein